MEKKEAISIIVNCARTYEEELCGKNILFVFKRNGQLEKLETCFMQHNFLHLTGVRYTGSSKNFYRECLEHKLVPDSIVLEANGTTEMKLRVLAQLVKINKSARMIGQYNNSKALLITHKLVGGVCGCVGFIQDGSFFIPNTALNEDIRDISVGSCDRIFAIFTKEIGHDIYNYLTYSAKNIDIISVLNHDDFRNIICLS